ncbi:hypothetical protein [Paractinoplanes atraurantiacus]|uniref:Uncharacterized protein n=1 Tax=Paractinoplanes atraurantiacus TaxID=1036182 RepID=A0A285HUP5_9ACTN|nr:hypothetical protein [Actinoplanes atraurantiacus]SNY38441.1 hypothetical protein SAMN05421748_105222 [Actinoplanes atraurantiacus]
MTLPASSTKSSELARIAAEAAGTHFSSVQFTLTHRAANGSVPAPAIEPDKEDPNGWPTDFCHFSVAGLSVSTSTWPSAMTAFSGRVQIGLEEGTGQRDTHSYSGYAVPNPGFLNHSTRKVEVIITLGTAHWSPTYREALMQALIIEKLTGLAAERDAPVLHLHTPVAPVPQTSKAERGDGSIERLRDAIGPCLRFSVGVDPALSGTRLDFETELAALAEEYGFGLKLSDQRFNRVRGEWFTIRGFDRERYRQARNRLFPDAPALTPRRAVIASVVGPSRTGTTAAAVAALRARGIGVLAASISSMRKTTFINLMLPVAADVPRLLPQWSGGWLEALPHISASTGHPAAATEETDDSLIDDWKVAVSPAMRCTYPPSSQQTGATITGRVPYPIWLWWQLPHRTVDTPALLSEVQSALRPHTRRCEVAYAQSRLCRGDVIRGRAKLVVMLSEEHRDHAAVQRLLTDATEAAQFRIRERLPLLGCVDPSKIRLRLSPRERWLNYADIST